MMMREREELEAAMAELGNGYLEEWFPNAGPIVAAARKQLALMAEKCDEPGCKDGVWFIQGSIRNGEPCIACHGSGKLYPPEMVGLLRKVVDAWAPDLNAYAKSQFVMELLDALGESER